MVTMTNMMVEVGALIEQARQIAGAYRRLTGRPLGITEEVAEYEAARLLGLQLAEARATGIWEASRAAVEGALARTESKARKRGALSVSEFQKIGRKVWPVSET